MTVFHSSGTITLPGPLQRRIDALAHSFLQHGQVINFSTPDGEPALISPDSVSWRIFKSPIAIFIGGVTAVLLEFAEPRVRDGVWQHSNFRTDPLTRLRRTGLAAMITVYGPRSRAEAMIAGVVKRHERVTGRTSEDEPYHANDPALLDWVQATAGFGFTEAYHTYVRRLTADDRGALFIEAVPAARLYGATGAPTSQHELDTLFEAIRPRLAASPVIFEFLGTMGQVPILPVPARPLQRVFLKAAIDILPDWVRERLRLGRRWSLGPSERAFVGALAMASDRLIIRSSPAIQSCRRLRLPDTYLYRPW
jgi:uncharacterized protein (DUF2236 family)